MNIVEHHTSIIDQIWDKKYSFLVFNRDMDKESVAARTAIYKAVVHEGMKIGVFSPSYRQSLLIYDSLMDISDIDLLVKDKIKKPDKWRVITKSDSFIESYPIGSTPRVCGVRYDIIIINEYAQFRKDILDYIIIPYIAISKNKSVNKMKLVNLTTSLSKNNHAYNTYKFYKQKMSDGNKDYFVEKYRYSDLAV